MELEFGGVMAFREELVPEIVRRNGRGLDAIFLPEVWLKLMKMLYEAVR